MDILFAIISIIILIYSAILHEIAHGLVAYRLGDPTAKLRGRLTLDPRPHIDPIMSILVPLMLIFSGSPIIFGGAKPVPVDPFNLRDGIKDMALVSIAGPLTNLTLAITAAILIHIIFPGASFGIAISSGFLGFVLANIVLLNLLLAIFNLLPIPPLDGSKLFAAILPPKNAEIYLAVGQRMGMFILIFLLFIPIGGFSLIKIVSSLIFFAIGLLGL